MLQCTYEYIPSSVWGSWSADGVKLNGLWPYMKWIVAALI